MKIIHLYRKTKLALANGISLQTLFTTDPELAPLLGVFKNLDITPENTLEWLLTPEATAMENVALEYSNAVEGVVKIVEEAFQQELPGYLILMPSYGEFDGFARYDRGEHTVLLGIDYPEASFDYLKALTAHELSHVYRDHSPEIWAHLGKPLKNISRKEYLDAGSAEEHLVSEGLATLFSMTVFPEIEPVTHHYYSPSEYEWCLRNHEVIGEKIQACLKSDQDVWSFYSPGRVSVGSPSRTHYYWAARKIQEMLTDNALILAAGGGEDPLKVLIHLHEKAAESFDAFR